MTCEECRLASPEYLGHQLGTDEAVAVESHVKACAACRAELDEMSALWRQLARLPQPQPSPAMRVRFHDMLEAYEHGLEKGRRDGGLRNIGRRLWGALWPRQPQWQAAVAAACLVVGFAAGSAFDPGGRFGKSARSTTPVDLAELRGELAHMRQLVTLSLLQQQSPSDRLRGVNWSYRVEQPAPEVPNALLGAVVNDENVNVRLAAVDALQNFGSNDRVRKALAAAVEKQESPLVQIAIIDLLATLHDPLLIKSLDRYAADQRLHPEVRGRAESLLRKLKIQ